MNAVRVSRTFVASLTLVASLTSAATALAQPAPPPAATGTIEGRVVAEATGSRLTDTEVTLVDLRRRVAVDDAGAFRFENVPAGTWLLRADGPAGRGVARADLAAGETVEVEIVIDLAVSDELVVTASADARSQLEVAQPTTVIAGEDLDERIEATLGQTLDEQPGVTSTYFGPGASRPVIRGLGGERIRTLQGGIGSADAASTSPDHAVSVDPLSAERIEILRGPATLLYGSSAVGGVVNVLDERIPDYVPERAVSGELRFLGGSVSDERSGAVSLTGGAGRLAWHADYARRETDDYEIPGHAEAELGQGDEEEHEEGPEGILENSSLENESAGFGVSYVADRGFLGLSVSGFDTLYGVPGHGHGGEEHDQGEQHGGEDGEAVRIDLEQRRVDLRGETLLGSRLFSGVKVRFGSADYEHVELEGEEVGTRFLNDSWEGRLELVQRKRGGHTGSLGVQVSSSDFEAIGEEAFVPPTVTDDRALFAFQELERGALSYRFGLRWENRDVDADRAGPGAASRSFDGVSGSLGMVWRFAEGYSFTTSLSRTERLPSATELFADGPHAATRAFEIGDPDLDTEESLGLDVSIKGAGERLSGSVNVFFNDFDGYIYESFTGDVEDGLDVVRFVQRDADFVGAEVDLVFRLAEIGSGHLDLRTRGDYVRAELADGTPLPRIPPLRLGAGLTWHLGPWHLLTEVRWTDAQDRVGENETRTAGSTVLNASTSYRFFVGGTVTDVMLRGSNLTDEEVRNHVSFLKDEVPLPGRDLSLLVRVAF